MMVSSPSPVRDAKQVTNSGSSKQRGRVNGIRRVVDDDSDDDKPLVNCSLKGAAEKVEPEPVKMEKVASRAAKAIDSDSEDDVPLAHRGKSSSKDPGSSKPPLSSSKPSKGNSAAAPAKAQATSSKSPATSSKSPATSSKSPASSSKTVPSSKPPVKRSVKASDDSEDDKPLAQKKLKSDSVAIKDIVESNTKKRPLDQKATTAGSASKKSKVEEDSEESSSDEDEEDDYDDDDEDEVPIATRYSSTQKSAVRRSLTTSAGKTKLVETKAKKVEKKIVKRGGKSKDAPGSGGGQKWTTLEHNGVIFPPPYQPHGVKMLYDGRPVDLTPEQEEVATMFAVMKDTDYASKPQFNANFWADWKRLLGPNHVIKKLELCDFTPIYEWHMREKEKKKQLTSEEKKRLKEEKAKVEEKYLWALVDGVKEKVGNFRVEPPGLFRGRGEHPKMGKLKRRVFPEDIVINIGKDAPVPECPMPGHKWKEVRHDNTVTWLAFWNDPINTKECKYVFLHPSSSLKAQSDREKYEKARMLKDYIDNIRKTYTKDFTSSDPTKRQIAVATYLIDRLALRAGNEKDDDEADTVGCCSLKVEHVSLVSTRSLEFDFLGKDSIRYYNTVEVEEKVFKAIGDFKKGKKEGADLFDKLDTSKLNAHLKEFMPGLTAKVFRTFNASITLDNQLVHTVGANVNEKTADYMRANKEVAILCNHQRSVSKTHGAQMERLEGKLAELKTLREELVKDYERAKKGKPPVKGEDGKTKKNQSPEQLQKKLDQIDVKIQKMNLDKRTKDDLKTVALGTSKINYMDPRITVAWCKRNEVPIEKVFNKSLLGKFAWAMDVEPDFRF